ncbi:MAG TPA: hypothetical protein RMI62_01090, partial [Polyangiaceae bacterium LLY-WYZ-15_(1-7)]|nr:hypothetical protein [Polyangiaceae bacterium LLY-WYZ-15_(1-7)]
MRRPRRTGAPSDEPEPPAEPNPLPPFGPTFWAAWAFGALCVAIPLFTPLRLPLLDYPQHAAMVSVLAHHGDPARGFDLYYELHPQISTYLGFYLGGALLGKIVGVDVALRLLLALYVAGTPLALAHLLRVLGRSPWPALLAFGAVWSWPLYLGFGAYVMAVPLALWTLAALFRLGDLEGAPARRVGEVVLASSLLFFTHALAYGVALLVAGVAAALFHHWRRWRRLVRLFLALVPSLACFGIWFGSSFVTDQADRLGAATATVHAQSGGELEMRSLEEKWIGLPQWFNEAFHDDADQQLRLGFAAVLGWLLLAGLVGLVLRWRREGRPAVPWRAWLVGLLLAGLYWGAPMSAANIWAISPRMVILGICGLALLLPLAVAPSAKPWLPLLVHAPALALAAWTGWVVHEKLTSVDEEAEDLATVLEAAEPGRRLYGMVYASRADALSHAVFLHYPAYYMVERGGLVGFTFINSSTIPLSLRTLGSSPYPGRRGEWEHRRFRYDLYGDFYDYFLTRRGGNLAARIGAGEGIEEVAEAGAWSLWRNTAPRRTVVYSFRENVHRAAAYEGAPGGEREACAPWDGERLECPHAEWTWVGPTEGELGRVRMPCTWTHPLPDGRPLDVVFENVPPEGRRVAGFAGVLDAAAARGGPDVRLALRVDGRPVDAIEAGAEPGYATFAWTIPPSDAPRRVTFR